MTMLKMAEARSEKPDLKITGVGLGGLMKFKWLFSVSTENNGNGDALYINNSDPILVKMSNKGLHDEMVLIDLISLTL